MSAEQLDLFLDSGNTTLTNEVITALCAHDSARAAQSIARLRAEAPAHRDLAAFESLYAFLTLFLQSLREADSSGLPPEVIATLRELLDTRVTPLATVLGNAAGGFLRGFWLLLARAADQPFDPDRPELHAAAMFLRAQAYDELDAAANSIVGHSTQRAVMRWRAIGRYRLVGLKGARLPIFLLAWHAADAFPDLLKTLGDSLLDQDWQAFEADVEELDASWFPAWYLVAHPESGSDLGAQLAQDHAEARAEIPARQACLLLPRILDLEKNGHSRVLVNLRARLRATDARFFAAYMRSRSVRHR